MITKVSENINPSMLNKVTRQLKELRIQRNEAIALVSKSVKSGSLVQLFLEKSLETIESQISALERLIEGYLKPLGEKYDEQSVKKNDYFSVREQMAISAGNCPLLPLCLFPPSTFEFPSVFLSSPIYLSSLPPDVSSSFLLSLSFFFVFSLLTL